MNKKFSTLVASLLLSSAFSVYAGNAKPMLATPTQVETRATSADVEKAVEATGTLPTYVAALNGHVLNGFTNNARVAYVGKIGSANTREQYVLANHSNGNVGVSAYSSISSANVATDAPDYYWTLLEGRLVANNGIEFSLTGLDEYIEVVPLMQDGKETPYFAIAKRDKDGNLQYAEFATTTFTWSTSKATEYDTYIMNAALFVSVETAYTVAYTGKELNDYLKNGFNLAISSLKDETAEITHSEAFNGVLKAMVDGTNLSTNDNVYHLMNEDGKFIWFDKDAAITSDGYSLKGQFKLVDIATASNTSDDFGRFQFKKADNGSGLVQVLVGDETHETSLSTMNFPYRLYVANVNDTYGLSIAKENQTPAVPAENWAATTLDASTIVNPKQFLTGQFYTIDFEGAVANAEAYKKDGRLAVRDGKADFVPANGLYEKAPEAQWAVSAYYGGTTTIKGFTLTNRENPSVSVTITELRKDLGKTYYRVVDLAGAPANATNAGIDQGDYITITAVENHKKNDGYKVLTTNDLKNTTWYLGQIRKAEGDAEVNVYWTENHVGSHQIGATVEEAKAAKWNLSLVNKNVDKHTSETDSILVVSELQEWNPVKSRIDAKKDTLVILPYAFQNRSNNEFVKMNDKVNLDYYICDETNKVNNRLAQRFALKLKADGETYNYVALRSTGFDEGEKQTYNADGGVIALTNKAYATKKVYQHNSADYGTWKNMEMYAEDANSLMFVTKVQAPEYRKLVTTANLDTIKLYRADNEAQVVYEKKDTKASTLLERPVSFLNIDNVEQFKDINPALYADTAYVNRGNNTCYQYLLGVNIEHKEGWYCEEHGFTATPPCKHAVPVSYNQGRYLINMIDTANILAADLKVSIHNNPFINETEEGNKCAKLAFVDAIHVLTDSVDMTKADKLYVINNEEDRTKYSVIDLSTPGFNVAKFAFKYTDSMVDDNFKIQTQWKDYDPNGYNKSGYKMHDEGYLRWVNGCLVVDETYQKGDVFNMNEDETRTPTANEEITAEGSVVVAGVNGAVVVKGAEGKSVIVSTILGKVVANEVLTSDNATIAAPAGVVVVSVDGESFKVVVK
ncbi:DUF6383 domain-containing protein [Parabacteroides sp. AGMB00274]|uniref:DUF6383 domain-containing protein n=1 Tax=Parabacteroides faecalis TaxID=2924040 RepID=A0ABT0C0N5_9BACT|nr:DUF6383 domain-containing protein [Parabacteroides faecalis]MCJ2380552.1 DUF6383 domain-containing protein [Parabacteroides faecalis]